MTVCCAVTGQQYRGRAVLHMALRNVGDRSYQVDGVDVMPGVRAVLKRMRAFADEVRQGRWLGYTGRPIRDVVSIGIGGSSLRAEDGLQALRPYQSYMICGCISCPMSTAPQLVETLNGLDPATTLFVIASKTFTTQETSTNADSARAWCLAALQDQWR